MSDDDQGPSGDGEFHFGDSLLARWDRPHGVGGAVMSYHYTFQKWACEKLGLPLELPDPVQGGPYRQWAGEEVERWRQDHAAAAPAVSCKRPMPG